MFGALSALRHVSQWGIGRRPEFSSARAFSVLMGVASQGAGVSRRARVDGGVLAGSVFLPDG